MIEEQPLEIIEREKLIDKIRQMLNDGYRLVQICCTRLPDKIEVNYSFGREYRFINLRVNLSCDDLELPSISSIYWAALFYENEMHDLFGVIVKDMALDFHGNFYKMAVKFPFGCDAQKGSKNG
ncbi:MAG: NADH-quinone oxidoreductase subunit C [bacterium]|nr:NADH-quinone oxidoreductase subunit C [bacterium]